MRVPVSVVAALVVIACSTPTGMCGCPPTLPWGVLARGTISTAASETVADATLAASAARGSCPSSAPETQLRIGGPPVDSTGRYRVGLFGTGADTLCVRLVARRTRAGRVDSLLSGRFTVALKQNDPLDSIRVDFQFP